MISKIKKIPKYLDGFYFRARQVGFVSALNEISRYNRFYFRILKRNGYKIKLSTVLYNFSFYTKIFRLNPDIKKEELFAYVPSTLTGAIYSKYNIDRKKITYDKYTMYKRMAIAGLSIPEIFYVTDGKLMNLWDQNKCTSFFDESANKKILAKPRFANGGVGIHFYNKNLQPNYIYQEFVQNHNKIEEFQQNSFCSTVRFVVYNNKNIVNPMGAYMRFNAGYIVDHSYTGSIYGTIDSSNGIIISDGFNAKGATFKTHPVSNKPFKGFQIPNWDFCLDEIRRTCIEFHELPLIAFDVAITQEDCKILEINAGCGILFLQYTQRILNHSFFEDFYPIRS